MTPRALAPLPVDPLAGELLEHLREHPRLILQAPTGSGKSTRVPGMLLDAGRLGECGRVVVLQPRRLAARMLAARVASERGGSLGGEVGYRIRLDNVTSRDTRIEFVTEGVLLRQMLNAPDLPGVAVLIFDEFHERHLYGDITLARALQIQETTRPDLLLIVMSATLDAAALEPYLAPCATLSSAGRTFPVSVEYLPRPLGDRTPVWEAAADELAAVAPGCGGDALVFMPGAYEISRTIGEIRSRKELRDFLPLPLHGELPPAEQDAAVNRQPGGQRKIVVATNVAETSLTIDGVRLVVDSGLARVGRFDPYRGINTLLIERISRASADQRAGRAGRTAPGRCLRLWTEAEHRDRPAQELPEVKRLDLAEVALTLKASGVDDLHAFRWLEPPEIRALDRAEALLRDLGALERANGRLTELGRRMLAFPMHPRYSRMLLSAQARNCVRPVALIAALTQGRDLLTRGGGNAVEERRDDLLGNDGESDFFRLLRAFRFAEKNNFNPDRCRSLGIHAQGARQTAQLFEQFLKIARDEGLAINETAADGESIARCVLAGFSDQLATRLDAGTLRCALVGGRRGTLARESVVQHAALFVAAEVREIQQRGDELNTLLTLATAVREDWLREEFPDDFSEMTDAFFDDTTRRVLGRRRTKFRDLTLFEKLTNDAPADAAASLLADEVLAGRCPLKAWDAAVDNWIARVNALRVWMPELGLPGIGPEDRRALVEHIVHGAKSYKDVKERPVFPTVKAWLSALQQGWIDEYAPERMEMTTAKGPRRVKLTYPEAGDGSPPVLAARIQELYDVTGGLRVATGRVPVTIQVLAPNQRPIQVTSDLANFWRESYPKIKGELQRKYPRHEWR